MSEQASYGSFNDGDIKPLQTKPPEDIREEEIKSLAGKYETLNPQEKVKLMQYIKADLAEERNRLAKSLQQLDLVIGEKMAPAPSRPDSTPAMPAPSQTAMPAGGQINRQSTGNGEPRAGTVGACILRALESGEVMESEQLYARACEEKREEIKRPTFRQTVQYLRGNGRIQSVGYGQYQIITSPA